MTTQTTPEAATRRLLPSTSRPPHTVEEVAARLRVSKMTVYRLIHDGELGHLRVGRSFRIPEPALRAYLAAAYTAGTEAGR